MRRRKRDDTSRDRSVQRIPMRLLGDAAAVGEWMKSSSHLRNYRITGSCYPQHPSGSHILHRVLPSELTLWDKAAVYASSLVVVGSFAWVPLFYAWAYRRWRSIPPEQKQRRALYAALLLSLFGLCSFGPHRHPSFAKWLNVRRWKLWDSWTRYLALEVINDQLPHPSNDAKLNINDQAILAFSPHGIFPFSIAFAALSKISERSFGIFRPVVATATQFFPLVRDLLVWIDYANASKRSVDQALQNGDRLGIIPGGIAEMFEGYPKPGTHKDEEYAIVRKGFLRMAMKHGVPVVPIYCFGATKSMKRLEIRVMERISLLLRIALCIFYGKWGLPIPFRQRLMYVVGNPILPPQRPPGGDDALVDRDVEEMYQQFCTELVRIFDRHKEAYGWAEKTLTLLSR